MSTNSSQPNKHDKPGAGPRRLLAEKKVRIKVVGVGGAGVNAIDRLVLDGFDEVSLLAVNTDAQALASSVVTEKLQIGENLTHGLGAGGDPQVGRFAAMEDVDLIRDFVEGYDLVFVAAGMGGGTGTGAGPIVARAAREEGALVLALVTMPFTHEGKRRMEIADAGIKTMRDAADAVICIPNDKLLALADEETSVLDAFRPTDEFLSNGVRKIWQMLTRTGLINIDFADLCSVLRRQSGETLFGFGEGHGATKVETALKGALSSPLLSDSVVLSKAESVLVGVTHGPDFTMPQLKSLLDQLHQQVGPKAACKQGIVVDENFADRLTVVVIASTGEAITSEAATGRPLRKKLSGTEKTSNGEGSPDIHKEVDSGVESGGEPLHRKGHRRKLTHEGAADQPHQEILKLDDATLGLFERGERTVVNGEDLDRPTFLRRGIVLKNG